MSRSTALESQRKDGRGHWPAGKRRSSLGAQALSGILRLLQRMIRDHTRAEIACPLCPEDARGVINKHSRREIAREFRLSDRTVRRWLAGEDVPTEEHWRKIVAGRRS